MSRVMPESAGGDVVTPEGRGFESLRSRSLRTTVPKTGIAKTK
jgi:hypothetical protein